MANEATTFTVKRACRTSVSQYETMLQFMLEHEKFANGRLVGIQGRKMQGELWGKLTATLNSDPSGPEKTAAAWQKTWTDWKCNLRKKASQLRQHQAGTGGGPKSTTTLSPVEEQLLQFLGNTSVVGDDSLLEGGLAPNISMTSIHTGSITPVSEPVVEPSTSRAFDPAEDFHSFMEFIVPVVQELSEPVSATIPAVPTTGKETNAQKRKSEDMDSEVAPKKHKGLTVAKPPTSERLEAFVSTQDKTNNILAGMALHLESIASSERKKAAAEERKADAEERKATALENMYTLLKNMLQSKKDTQNTET